MDVATSETVKNLTVFTKDLLFLIKLNKIDIFYQFQQSHINFCAKILMKLCDYVTTLYLSSCEFQPLSRWWFYILKVYDYCTLACCILYKSYAFCLEEQWL